MFCKHVSGLERLAHHCEDCMRTFCEEVGHINIMHFICSELGDDPSGFLHLVFVAYGY